MAGRPKLNFYELAVAVKLLFDTDKSVLYGVEQETGLSRRTVRYLLDVGNLIDERKIPKELAEDIGWTKLQIVARHIKEKGGASVGQVNGILNTAADKNLKARDLRAVLNGEIVIETRTAVFNLTKADRLALDDALVTFGAQKVPSGLANKEGALMQLIGVAMANKS